MMVSARANGNDTGLNDAIEEFESIFADGICRLRAAVSEDQAVVANAAQHAEQVIEGLRASITGLEAKLKETEDTLHRKELASQKTEEILSTEIRDLQGIVKKNEEALEGRDSEINDLKSKRDLLAEQVTHLESAIQKAREEAASQAQHAEQAIEGLKASITGLEAKLKETEDTLHRKELASQKTEETPSTEIRDLQGVVKKNEEALEGRDSEINDLKSKRDLLVEQVTHLESAVQKAREEAASQAQHAERVIEGLKTKIATLEAQRTQPDQIVGGTDWTIKELEQDRDSQAIDINAELPQTNAMKKTAGVTSVVTKPARKTVSRDAFDRMIAEFSELTNVIGSIASLIVRDHVKALGESMEEFPQRRLTELLDSLSGQISDYRLKAKFRARFTKV